MNALVETSSGIAAAILMKSDGQDICCLSLAADIPSTFQGSCLRQSRPPGGSRWMQRCSQAQTDVFLIYRHWGFNCNNLRRIQKC